jgi:hypothetical protein
MLSCFKVKTNAINCFALYSKSQWIDTTRFLTQIEILHVLEFFVPGINLNTLLSVLKERDKDSLHDLQLHFTLMAKQIHMLVKVQKKQLMANRRGLE